jgi:DMSO/TMAO reductase YedYZ molybdopterin-dependent catalytic subunit
VNLTRTGVAGALAGLVAVGCMELGAWLGILRTVPELVAERLLQVLPGPVFGFLIDHLQHAGKVVEEAGLLLGMVAALAVLAVLHRLAVERWTVPATPYLPAAVAWAVTVLVVLPLGGALPLGIDESPTTPFLWALVYVAYAVVLDVSQRAAEPTPELAADPGRRRLLALVPVGAAVLGAGLTGYRLVPGWIQAITAPPESGVAGPSRPITPAGNFYVVSKNFQDPSVSAAGWSLGVRGLVDRPLSLSLAALRALPATTQIVTMECVSNLVGGELISTIAFTGVPLGDLIAMAGPRQQADALAFHCRDDYVETLSLAQATASRDVMIAYGFGDGPLPRQHGYPARVLVPGRYGMKSAKWLDWVEVRHGETGGYWEGQGFDRQAVVKTTARLDTPRDGGFVKLGDVALAGIALAGDRGISAVEWSADGGRTWSPAQLMAPPSPLAWTLWTATWQAGGEGAHTLAVRARDGRGDLQTSRVAPSFPSGASGYHEVRVNVFR